MCFSSSKDWVGTRKRTKSTFFVTFILSKGNSVNILVLFQCIVHWISFQNIYNFIFKETLLHTLLCLVFKIVENFRFFLKVTYLTVKQLPLYLYNKFNCILCDLILRQTRSHTIPVDAERKLSVHKTFRGRPGRLLNVLCTSNLRPVSTGIFQIKILPDLTLHFQQNLH